MDRDMASSNPCESRESVRASISGPVPSPFSFSNSSLLLLLCAEGRKSGGKNNNRYCIRIKNRHSQ